MKTKADSEIETEIEESWGCCEKFNENVNPLCSSSGQHTLGIIKKGVENRMSNTVMP